MVKINNKPDLIVNEIQDVYLRRNFQALRDYFQSQNQLLDFKFFEVIFDKAENNKKVMHEMKFVPTDIIITGAYGSSGAINVGLFDSKYMDISASGPCRLRFFAGRPWNSDDTTFNKTDTLSF